MPCGRVAGQLVGVLMWDEASATVAITAMMNNKKKEVMHFLKSRERIISTLSNEYTEERSPLQGLSSSQRAASRIS